MIMNEYDTLAGVLLQSFGNVYKNRKCGKLAGGAVISPA